MEKTNDAILMKSRSAGACIGSGFNLFSGSFRRIFRYTWLPALAYSVIAGLVGAFVVTEYPRLMVSVLQAASVSDAMHQQLLTTAIAMAVGLLLVFAATVIFFAYGFAMLRTHKDSGTISVPVKWLTFPKVSAKRTAMAAVWLFLVHLFLCAVCSGILLLGDFMPKIAALAILAVAVLVIIGLLLPLVYIVMKYVLADGGSFPAHLRQGYATGLRHSGFLLMVLLIELIAYAVIAFVIMLPALILSIANMQAHTGLLYGDPLGMPSSVVPLTVAVFVASSFLQAYIMLSMLFPLYYSYGAIETQEAEKKAEYDKLLKP